MPSLETDNVAPPVFGVVLLAGFFIGVTRTECPSSVTKCIAAGDGSNDMGVCGVDSGVNVHAKSSFNCGVRFLSAVICDVSSRSSRQMCCEPTAAFAEDTAGDDVLILGVVAAADGADGSSAAHVPLMLIADLVFVSLSSSLSSLSSLNSRTSSASTLS